VNALSCTPYSGDAFVRLAISIAATVALICPAVSAAPSAQVAKQCLRAAYLLYPYQRPGAAPMRSDRMNFFRNCMVQHDAATDHPADATTDAAKGDSAH
jgi:hypothetical protein